MFYNFDVNRWIAELIPKIIRRRLLYALLKALLSPVAYLYGTFTAYRQEISSRLSHNAFTIYLEKFLNGTLGTEGIYIVDHIIEQTLYLALKDEGMPPDHMSMKQEDRTPVYISNSDRLVGGFTVMVPRAVATKENLDTVSKWVNYYKYAGTQFNIKTY